MGEHDAIEKVQSDHETRLRAAEATIGVMKSQLDQMVSNTEDIKERIGFLTTGTATHEHIIRVESAVSAAHKRLDEFNREFWKMQAEHVSCIKIKNDMADAVRAIREDVAGLKISVISLQKDKDAVTSFFSTRLGTIIDKLLQFLPWVLMWLYLQNKLSMANMIPK